MKPVTITGANANPGAPRDWDPDRDGTCGRLPIRVAIKKANGDCGTFPPEDGDRFAACESAWELESGEFDLLRAGGVVILHVVGWQVPVALRVEPASAALPSSKPKREAMGNCIITVHVTGAHHNGLTHDIDQMATRFVANLRAQHNVTAASVMSGGETDLLDEFARFPLKD